MKVERLETIRLTHPVNLTRVNGEPGSRGRVQGNLFMTSVPKSQANHADTIEVCGDWVILHGTHAGRPLAVPRERVAFAIPANDQTAADEPAPRGPGRPRKVPSVEA